MGKIYDVISVTFLAHGLSLALSLNKMYVVGNYYISDNVLEHQFLSNVLLIFFR